MWSLQKHLFDIEKVIVLAGFGRTDFSDVKNDDLIDAQFTEAFFRIRKETIVLVWISQNRLSQCENNESVDTEFSKTVVLRRTNNDCAHLDFASHVFHM